MKQVFLKQIKTFFCSWNPKIFRRLDFHKSQRVRTGSSYEKNACPQKIVDKLLIEIFDLNKTLISKCKLNSLFYVTTVARKMHSKFFQTLKSVVETKVPEFDLKFTAGVININLVNLIHLLYRHNFYDFNKRFMHGLIATICNKNRDLCALSRAIVTLKGLSRNMIT